MAARASRVQSGVALSCPCEARQVVGEFDPGCYEAIHAFVWRHRVCPDQVEARPRPEPRRQLLSWDAHP